MNAKAKRKEQVQHLEVHLSNIARCPEKSGGVGVLPSGSSRGIPRRVVMIRDSLRSERDGARNTRI